MVLTIIAVITGMGMTAGLGALESARRAQTSNKLDVIETTLMSYRTAYNRLPCPADPTIANTAANYGVEAANPGSCTGGAPAISATFTDTTNNVVEGAVPFNALGLPEEYMYDGWGRKFAYAVNYNVTATNAMSGESLAESCKITVNDAASTGGNRSTGAVYVLVSYGPDGHGGYLRSGSRNNAGSNNSNELINCHCNTATAAETTYAANYVQQDPTLDPTTYTDQFGDYVRFKERWQMATSDDFYMTGGSPACTPGIRIDGNITNGNLGMGPWGAVMTTADVNGDGIQDLIIGGTDPSNGTGVWYVVFGQAGGITPNPFPVSGLNGTNGFEIIHSCYGGYNQTLLPGDFNGDGIQDLAIAWGNSVSIVFGQTSGWPAVFDLCNLTTTSNPKAVNLWGGYDAYNNPNIQNFAVADVNGDGKADLILLNSDGSGASNNERNGDVYVYFGSTNIIANWPSSWANFVSALDGTHGFYLEGHRQNGFGYNIGFGDFNGDGIQDMLIAENGVGGATGGMMYIVWGQPTSYTWPNSGVEDMGALPANGSVGVQINQAGGNIAGYLASDSSAYQLGDVNGDGIADIQFGGHNITINGDSAAGAMFTIFGMSKAAWAARSSNTFDVTTLNGTNGTVLAGTWNGPNNVLSMGQYADTPADINGDGKGDLVGQNAHTYGQACYVVFGPTSGSWASPLSANPASITGTNGFVVWPSGNVYSAADAVDVTGDGKAELLCPDPGANSNTGQVFVVQGGLANYASGVITSANIGNYGWLFTGANSGDGAGSAVVNGDFNHDGVQDFAIAAPYASPGGVSGAGSVYVIWGSSKGWTTPFSLSTVQ